MADLRDVLAGQIAISDQIPTEGECQDDPLVVDLDDHKWEGTPGFLPRHYLRYPLVGAVPPMADVETISRFVNMVIMHGARAIFVSSHPVPRALCAARTLHISIGGTIQGAIMLVNRVDDRAFDTDRVLDVILALGGGAK